MPEGGKDKREVKHERTTQKLVSQMIDKYVGIEEQRARFLQDGARAWKEYCGRGIRASSREVLAWLAGWSDEDESEGPECHR